MKYGNALIKNTSSFFPTVEPEVSMKAMVNKVNIVIVQRDILTLPVDAIVVVTDPTLSVADELLALAGSIIQDQTNEIGPKDVGSAVITDAGNLNGANKIIHAVAPRWGEGSERGKLRNVIWEALRLTEEHMQESVAFPPVSTGTLGFPLESCAKIMLSRIIDFTFEDIQHLQNIYICLDEEPPAFEIFVAELNLQTQNL
jgi:O-acetyl-ADP-ribose deacetylase